VTADAVAKDDKIHRYLYEHRRQAPELLDRAHLHRDLEGAITPSDEFGANLLQ
jgi:hypothetical protein